MPATRGSRQGHTVNGKAVSMGRGRSVVSIEDWWTMQGACGAHHPHLAGVRCVRDEGHPGTWPTMHRFWRKMKDGTYKRIQWLTVMELARRRKLPSPRPAPGRSHKKETT